MPPRANLILNRMRIPRSLLPGRTMTSSLSVLASPPASLLPNVASPLPSLLPSVASLPASQLPNVVVGLSLLPNVVASPSLVINSRPSNLHTEGDMKNNRSAFHRLRHLSPYCQSHCPRNRRSYTGVDPRPASVMSWSESWPLPALPILVMRRTGAASAGRFICGGEYTLPFFLSSRLTELAL